MSKSELRSSGKQRSCDFANGAGERHRFNNIHPQHFCRLISCERENYKSEPIHPISPSTQLTKIPYKITGPAIVKILQPIPNTCPSF